MAVTKNEWRRPELTVLVRSRAEEAVLKTCKVALQAGPNTLPDTCTSPGNCANPVQS